MNVKCTSDNEQCLM